MTVNEEQMKELAHHEEQVKALNDEIAYLKNAMNSKQGMDKAV